MKRVLARVSMIALACLWIPSVAAAAAAAVPFSTAKKDIESYWKKNYSRETILEIKPAGEGTSSVKIVNLKKIPYYSVPAQVRIRRADGSVANFSVSAIYKKPGAAWIFEDVATGNVQQEKAGGQDAPPLAEAEALIGKGWTEKFSQEGDTDIKILKVHPNPTFKAYGQRFWYRYRIDLEYTMGRTHYQCKGQEVDLVKENTGAPWTFKALKNTSLCQGQ